MRVVLIVKYSIVGMFGYLREPRSVCSSQHRSTPDSYPAHLSRSWHVMCQTTNKVVSRQVGTGTKESGGLSPPSADVIFFNFNPQYI